MMSHLSQMITQWVELYGYIGIFVAMAVESSCIPIPSEVIMPFGGYMVWAGHLNFWGVIFAGTFGNLVGSLITFLMGKYAGREAFRRYGKYVALSDKHLLWAEKWFERRGHITVFVARLLPAVRTFISLPAGLAAMSLILFSIYTLLGSFLWSLVLTAVGLGLGREWTGIQHFTHPLTYVVLVALVVIFMVPVLKRKRRKTYL